MGVISNKIRHAALNKAQKNSSSFSKAKYLSSRKSTLPNQGMGASASTSSASSNLKSGLGEKLTGDIEIKMPLPIKIIISSIVIIVGGFLAAIIGIVLLFSEDEAYIEGLSASGYYVSKCDNVTVLFVDKNNNYAPTGSATYSLLDYVAGVVAAEVGGFNNLEVYKAFAVAARTYGESHYENCAIEASARKQAFKDITKKETENEKLIYQAVEETLGVFLLKSDGTLHSTQYDAFACIDKDENFYTISQMNQKIPKTWIDARIDKSTHKGWFNCSGKSNLVSHHGNGMSQYGALYLATERNYNYSQILSYYYGDDAVLSTLSYVSSIAGLNIQSTTNNSNQLHTSLAHYLADHGSSISELNEYIKINVEEAGKGTREGVVTAAVSLINYLYDNYKLTLPYYWGGKYAHTGVSSDFGTYQKSNISRNGNYYYYKSFDCSGFVQWAIINGGFVDPGTGTGNFDSKFGGDSCVKSDPTCVGKLGDLINSADEHVVLIVGIDEKSQQYLIAESSNDGVITRKIGMHSGAYADYKILHLESFYNNIKNLS